MASQFGLNDLTTVLLKHKSAGGFGADPLKGDLINQRPIHYAIAHKNVENFEVHMMFCMEAEEQ